MKLCVKCDREIPKARVEALPNTNTCVECSKNEPDVPPTHPRPPKGREKCPKCGHSTEVRFSEKYGKYFLTCGKWPAASHWSTWNFK